jgi:hypothetical protein
LSMAAFLSVKVPAVRLDKRNHFPDLHRHPMKHVTCRYEMQESVWSKRYPAEADFLN